MRTLIVSVLMFLVATTGFSGVVNQFGTYANWATVWTSLGGYDSSNNVTQSLDFVGDSNNPGLYTANTNGYIFFRMRVNADTYGSPAAQNWGAHILTIDIANYGTNGIDYAFAWDSKSNDNTKHGLEMCVASENGPTWGVSQLADMDKDPSGKATNDINGLISGSTYRTTDGYVRTTDSQSTTSFGNTTFIDFAVKWSYLETYTALRSNQVWQVGLASIANATDHNAFNADVSGANLTDNITVGWSAPMYAAVPEPASIMMVAFGGGLIVLIRRFYGRS